MPVRQRREPARREPARCDAQSVKNPDWPADRVERRSVGSLVPYARNARTHSPEQVDQIAASIREWGWTVPVLIDETGALIAGHGRVLAAKKLGLAEAPAMIAKGWSEAQKRAYVLADNKLAQNAGWDHEALQIELLGLSEIDFDLRLVGFSAAEISGILEQPLEAISASDQSASLNECYELIIALPSEVEQQALLEELHARGFSCRALIS